MLSQAATSACQFHLFVDLSSIEPGFDLELSKDSDVLDIALTEQDIKVSGDDPGGTNR